MVVPVLENGVCKPASHKLQDREGAVSLGTTGEPKADSDGPAQQSRWPHNLPSFLPKLDFDSSPRPMQSAVELPAGHTTCVCKAATSLTAVPWPQ